MKGLVMKLYIPVMVAMLSGLIYADSIEIKTGDGYREPLTTIYGSYKSKNGHKFPYVCYDKRIKVVADGEMYLTYKGCTRITTSCKSVGRAHFGKYPNDYESYKARKRCENSRPRFVD